MRRILLVVDSLDVGGAERHVVDLAAALQERGHQATVACSHGGALRAEIQAAQIPVQVLMDRRVKRRVSLTYGMRLREIVRQDQYDLVHAHLYASAVAASVATWASETPFVITEHSQAHWQGPTSRRISLYMERRASLIVAVSDAIRRQVVRRDERSADRVMTIPNGIRPACRLAPAAVLGEGPIIGVVARLQQEKGVDLFLNAAAHIGRVVPDCRFVVVGNGPLREPLVHQARALALDERVQFLGCREDAREIIARLDVLVIPSRSEGAPLVTLEAMAAGVPVVASATGGIPEQIGQAGLLMPAGDVNALADACIGLLRDPGRARRMGEAGRMRVERLFSHAAMVDRLEEAYELAQAIPKSGKGVAPACITALE